MSDKILQSFILEISVQTSYVTKARLPHVARGSLTGADLDDFSPSRKSAGKLTCCGAGWISGRPTWVCHFAKLYQGTPCPGANGVRGVRGWGGSGFQDVCSLG